MSFKLRYRYDDWAHDTDIHEWTDIFILAYILSAKLNSLCHVFSVMMMMEML